MFSLHSDQLGFRGVSRLARTRPGRLEKLEVFKSKAWLETLVMQVEASLAFLTFGVTMHELDVLDHLFCMCVTLCLQYLFRLLV